MAVTIDELQIEIQARGTSAADGVERLTKSLKGLKGALNTTSLARLKDGLSAVVAAIAPLPAMAGTKLSSLAKGMTDLANAPKITASTIRNIKMLAKAGKELADIDFGVLSKISSALSGMGGGINTGAGVSAADSMRNEIVQASNLPAIIANMSTALVPTNNGLDTIPTITIWKAV